MNLSQAAEIFKSTLKGYDGFWCVAGGWAIDLYLNRQTRSHEDFEIVVLREESDQIFRQFEKFNPQKIFSGEPPEFVPWRGEPIEDDVIQIRLNPIEGFDFDLLLTPSEDDQWICRRDLSIRRPLCEITAMTELGVPVLRPEIVLLFKAKYLRDCDLNDYANVAPFMTQERQKWLAESVQKIHPGHIWASR